MSKLKPMVSDDANGSRIKRRLKQQPSTRSFVVVDHDVEEDSALTMISVLTSRIKELEELVSKSEDDDKIKRRQRQQIENLRRRISDLEEQNKTLEEGLREERENSRCRKTNTSNTSNLEREIQELKEERDRLQEYTDILESKGTASMVTVVKQKKEEMKRKDDRIKKMKEEIDDLRAEKEEIDNLRAEKEEIEMLYADEQQNFSDEKAALEGRIEELESQLKKGGRMKGRMSDSRRGNDQSQRETSDELKCKDERIKQLTEDLENLRTEKEELEGLFNEEQQNFLDEKAALESRIEELESQLKRGSSDDKRVRARTPNSRRENDLNQLQKDLEKCQKNLDAANQEKTELEDKCDVLQHEIDGLKAKHSDELRALTNNHRQAMKDQKAEARDEANRLRKELDSRMKDEIDNSLTNDVNDLRKRNEELDNRLCEYEIRNNKLRQKKEELVTTNRELRESRSSREAELLVLQRKLADNTIDKEALEADLEQKMKDVVELHGQIAELRAASEKVSRSDNTHSEELLKIFSSLEPLVPKEANVGKIDRRNPRSLADGIKRIIDLASVSAKEQEELLQTVMKEKAYYSKRQGDDIHKLEEMNDRLRQEFEKGKNTMTEKFNTEIQELREFITFLQTRLELVTSPFFPERIQPVPLYDGNDYYVGQLLPSSL